MNEVNLSYERSEFKLMVQNNKPQADNKSSLEVYVFLDYKYSVWRMS